MTYTELVRVVYIYIHTCLSARVVESGRRFDRHSGDGAVADLGARVAPSARFRQLLRLGRLASEVSAAHHLLGGRLASETAGDEDLFRRRRLPPTPNRKHRFHFKNISVCHWKERPPIFSKTAALSVSLFIC